MHDLDSLSESIGPRLRSLPDEAAAPYGWEEFRRRAGWTRERVAERGDLEPGERGTLPVIRRPWLASRMTLAASALLLVAAGALIAWMRGELLTPAGLLVPAGVLAPARVLAPAGVSGRPPSSAAVSRTGQMEKGIDAIAGAQESGAESDDSAGKQAADAATVASATEARAAAERWLASQPASPAIVRVGTYAAIAGLEDRIAQLDDLMTDARAAGMRPTSLTVLERQRARLVSSLAQVRYAETLAAETRR